MEEVPKQKEKPKIKFETPELAALAEEITKYRDEFYEINNQIRAGVGDILALNKRGMELEKLINESTLRLGEMSGKNRY